MKPQSNYWLDVAVRDILDKYPNGEIIISSGISPSASYHIGHFREIMTADALTWGLKQAGREARHLHVVDNFDPLRKRYHFLPESFEQYVGWPISLVPDPIEACKGEHKTYAEHFYREFEGYARQMGIVPDEVIRSYEQLYANGRMAQSIEKSVANVDRIKMIMKEVSKRDLPDDWIPLQLMGPNRSFTELTFKSIDTESKRIIGVNEDGTEHSLDYTAGEAKLNWRLDWPARWQVLGVMVEPFSAQEHGAAGGSYETGVRFDREIFDYEPPIPGVRYANIHMQGDNKKMSSSSGNLITPEQALQIMPPEVLRYFIARSRPERTLFWESNQGLMKLLEEFAQVRQAIDAGEPHEFAEAYAFAMASKVHHTISSVPFNHLIQVWQASRGDQSRALEVLKRTDFAEAVRNEPDVLEREFVYVAKWLELYAPEAVKFSVQETLPRIELTEQQRDFLSKLATTVAEGELDGEGMHQAIYSAIDAAGLKPGDAFKALYRVILGKDSGPKAGWFLASLETSWLVERLRLTK